MEEFANLTLDKQSDKDLKSDEQLKRHSIDKSIEARPVDRALHLLSVGEEIQRLSVVLNLPTLLETEEAACLNRVVPKVQLALPSGSTEFHMAASSAFRTILERKLVSSRTFTQTFLQSILSCIDNRDQVVANAWLETLLDVIDLLPIDTIKSDIFPLAAQKAALAQRVGSKLVACRLLGRMCLRLDAPANRTLALPLVLSLCQDVKAEVRACVAQQLPAVARGLGSEAVKPALLPSVVELAGDEDAEVRRCTAEALVRLMPHLQPDTLKHAVAPLTHKLAEQSLRAEDAVMVTIAKVFGELCLNLEAVLTAPEKKWLLGHYVAMSQLGLRQHHPSRGTRDFRVMADLGLRGSGDKHSSCRLNCAYNFPAVMCFARNADLADMLFDTLSELSADPYFAVRKTMAAGLHEVARLLGPGNTITRVELVRLLKDVEEEVLNGLVPNLGAALMTLLPPDTPDNVAAEVGRGLLKCEGLVAEGNDWRLHQLLLQQFEVVPLVMPSDFVNLHVTPIVFARVVTARQVPVRYAAARALLQNLRYNTRANQRQDLRSRIIADLCLGRSCFQRMAFIKLCGFALDIFSRKYFKEFLFQPLVDRVSAGDCVANNRLVFVRLLPRLKSIMRLPADKKMLVSLEMAVRKLLSSERDRDVNAALKQAVVQLDKIVVPSEASGDKLEPEEARRIDEETRLASVKMDVRPTGSRPPMAPPTPMRGLEAQRNAMSSKSGQLSTIDTSRGRTPLPGGSGTSSMSSSPASSIGNVGGRSSSSSSGARPPGSPGSPQPPWGQRPGSASKADPLSKNSSGLLQLLVDSGVPFLQTPHNSSIAPFDDEVSIDPSANDRAPTEPPANDRASPEPPFGDKLSPIEPPNNGSGPLGSSDTDGVPKRQHTKIRVPTELSTNNREPTEQPTNGRVTPEPPFEDRLTPIELPNDDSGPLAASATDGVPKRQPTKIRVPSELSTNDRQPTDVPSNGSGPKEPSTTSKSPCTRGLTGRFGFSAGSPGSERPRSTDFTTMAVSRLPVRKKM